MSRPIPIRRLRRLRTLLALLAAATALLIAAACRFESTARAVAAIAALGCLVAWVFILEAEGRLADRLERRGPRRRGAWARRAPRSIARRQPPRRAA